MSILFNDETLRLVRGISDDVCGHDFILVLPHDNDAFNLRVTSAFKAKLHERHGIVISGFEARSILEVYSLYAFTDKLIIGSLDLPHGRKLRNLLDSGVATIDELINDVILGAL